MVYAVAYFHCPGVGWYMEKLFRHVPAQEELSHERHNVEVQGLFSRPGFIFRRPHIAGRLTISFHLFVRVKHLPGKSNRNVDGGVSVPASDSCNICWQEHLVLDTCSGLSLIVWSIVRAVASVGRRLTISIEATHISTSSPVMRTPTPCFPMHR